MRPKEFFRTTFRQNFARFATIVNGLLTIESLPWVNPLCLRNYQDAHRAKSAADRIV
jgi:hypothetical protein